MQKDDRREVKYGTRRGREGDEREGKSGRNRDRINEKKKHGIRGSGGWYRMIMRELIVRNGIKKWNKRKRKKNRRKVEKS